MKKIKILLVEDNRLLRDGIVAMIKKEPDMHIVATIGGNENIVTSLSKYKQILFFSILVCGTKTVYKLLN